MKKSAPFLVQLLILCFAIFQLPLVRASEDSWTTMKQMPTARTCVAHLLMFPFVFMFDYFIKIVTFESAVPTANPRTI